MSIYASRPILLYCCFVAAILGGAMGSFLHCAAWRMVRGESFVRGRSRCPACGHVLGPAELIPLLSWPLLRGKCRWCGTAIPVRYEIAECFFACVSVACLLRFDLSAACLRNYVFLCCLFCLALTDWESMIIPDGTLLTAAGAWLLCAPFLGWKEALGGVAAGVLCGGGILVLSLVMDRVLGRESMGGGDIKLFTVAGLYLGPVGTLFAVLLACVLGLLPALMAGRGRTFPFGPSIAAAVGIMLFCGEWLTAWYLGLAGL